MATLRKVRLIAAIVLLLAVFLPLSECAKHPDDATPPPKKSLTQTLFPRNNESYEYSYAMGVVKPSTWQGGLFALVALLWPIAAVLLDRRIRDWRWWPVIYVVEILLCAGTTYWVWMFTALGRWLYGTYVVFAGIGAFAVATVVLLFRRANLPPG